jgi:SHS2 domain-containing protein
MLEAWGTSRVACLEQAVAAVIESFADVSGVVPLDREPIVIDAVSDEDTLVALLEEVLFLIDARSVVPVSVELEEHAEGRVTGTFSTIAAEEAEVVGAVPKGISRSGLVFERRDGRWRCRVIVDV